MCVEQSLQKFPLPSRGASPGITTAYFRAFANFSPRDLQRMTGTALRSLQNHIPNRALSATALTLSAWCPTTVNTCDGFQGRHARIDAFEQRPAARAVQDFRELGTHARSLARRQSYANCVAVRHLYAFSLSPCRFGNEKTLQVAHITTQCFAQSCQARLYFASNHAGVAMFCPKWRHGECGYRAILQQMRFADQRDASG